MHFTQDSRQQLLQMYAAIWSQSRHLQLVVARVAGKGGVVALHIELEFVRQAVLVQEAHGGGNIPVVLVLGGLLHEHSTAPPWGAAGL